MAFSLRKMLTNISYFKKIDNESVNTQNQNTYDELDDVDDFQTTEPDSTVRQCSSLNIPDSVKIFNTKKTSLSDTDLLTLNVDNPIRHRHKRCKKLKLDIKKASQSLSERLNQEESCESNVENTPKHILLECATSEFSNKLKGFDFSKEFDIYDGTSDDQWSNPFEEENIDIESFSDHSDSDVSIGNKKKSIKMCRKVQSMQSGSSSDEIQHPPSSPESFGDIEMDKSELERLKLLYNYQNKLEKVENLLKDMLNEFQFHIEVSKVFNNRTLPDTDPGNPEIRKPSPTDSWSVIMDKEDGNTKVSVKKQLESIKHSIEQFINIYLKDYEKDSRIKKCRKYTPRNKGKQRCDNKKKMKYYDFPDLREAMINLFSPESNDTNTSDSDDSLSSKCSCSCHHETSSHTDSGLISKTNDRSSNQSITSSIGNFSLDTSTLTAYSESLDQIISYNSFEDSFYNTFIQKTAVERITFYIQVHNIQLNCDLNDENEPKTLTFYCQSCKLTEYNENDLLKHILGQNHCEKIHFQYKTAYIKKCMSEGKEIQPSTVLNPMKMYRDDNKIVCFGNAVYACSLCFENEIIGESVLMMHCAEKCHIEKREKLNEVQD